MRMYVMPSGALNMWALYMFRKISMTASTLYEAVEPSILWKQLLAAIMNDLTEDNKTGVGFATAGMQVLHTNTVY